MQKPDPQFQALPNERLGQNWCVQVVWRSGVTETLTGFENQYSALEWIRLKSANWVADKIMQRPT
jgi:hypothetical protein